MRLSKFRHCCFHKLHIIYTFKAVINTVTCGCGPCAGAGAAQSNALSPSHTLQVVKRRSNSSFIHTFLNKYHITCINDSFPLAGTLVATHRCPGKHWRTFISCSSTFFLTLDCCASTDCAKLNQLFVNRNRRISAHDPSEA